MKFHPRFLLIMFLGLFIATYAVYQARYLIFGPEVEITSLKNGEEVFSQVIILEGYAKNIAWLSLNDRQIFTNEEGAWSEKLIVPEGLSIMTIEARDRFGREITESVEIIYN